MTMLPECGLSLHATYRHEAMNAPETRDHSGFVLRDDGMNIRPCRFQPCRSIDDFNGTRRFSARAPAGTPGGGADIVGGRFPSLTFCGRCR